MFSDEPEVWKKELKRSRPKFLEAFREFKEPDYKHSGGPAYGTVLLCDDSEWLYESRDELAATLAFLAATDGELPSELFSYYCWRLADPANDPKVWSFTSRHAHMTESDDGLHLFPPPVLRGATGEHGLAVDAAYAKQLLSLWDENPRSRVITAVKLSFRAEFGDQFTVTNEQYHAGKAAAVEAALGILQPELRAQFVEGLSKLFGSRPMEVAFYHGWYTARSLFVHGLGVQTDDNDKHLPAYTQFRENQYAVRLTAAIARYSIFSALGEEVAKGAKWSKHHPIRWMQRSLYSGQRWDELSGLLCQAKAADTIEGGSVELWAQLRELAHGMADSQLWSTVRPVPSDAKVTCALKTAWLLASRLNAAASPCLSEPNEVQQSLEAAKVSFGSNDERAIVKWLAHHHGWARPPYGGNHRLRICLSLVWHLMRWFSPMHKDQST